MGSKAGTKTKRAKKNGGRQTPRLGDGQNEATVRLSGGGLTAGLTERPNGKDLTTGLTTGRLREKVHWTDSWATRRNGDRTGLDRDNWANRRRRNRTGLNRLNNTGLGGLAFLSKRVGVAGYCRKRPDTNVLIDLCRTFKV